MGINSGTAGGYFISAFGGKYTQGYMLIGMRVQGDTMPRPIHVATQNPVSSSSVKYFATAKPAVCHSGDLREVLRQLHDGG